MHCLAPLSGMQGEGPATRTWLRTTVCYRKINGRWKVVHERILAPG